MWFRRLVVALATLATGLVHAQDPNSCPGYKASNVVKSRGRLTADLTLKGSPCNIYGDDLQDLKLLVEYQTEQRLHVKIYDAQEQVFQVPNDLIAEPAGSGSQRNWHGGSGDLAFNMTDDPFAFSVTRRSNGQVLFDTTGETLVFESQYLRIRTSLPDNPTIYGLDESSDSFRHDPANYSHTIYNSGQPFMPAGTNLYGAYPIYYDHRGKDGTHAVFLRNMNGQLVKMGVDSGHYLEWNTIGGVFDFYFLAGPTPMELSTQYADLVGYPTMMPYWGFGFHQCRYGYQDTYETAAVVANYSAANIPLETIWNDIDYMDYRSTFSLDAARFPLQRMREFVNTLHANDQHYIMMVDPAVASRDYKPFHDGVDMDAFMKQGDGSLYTGVVWPGPTNFPDWFAPGSQAFWDKQFDTFFNKDTGVDIDGLWIDMNEPSNFCDYPCPDPVQFSIENRDPPRPIPARMHSPYAIPGFPSDFQPDCFVTATFTVDAQTQQGDDLLLLGGSLSIGQDRPYFAPKMNGGSGAYNLTVQVPANTALHYSYPRYTHEGDYILDAQNRTLRTGKCGSFVTVSDHYDTGASTVTVPTNKTNPRDTSFSGANTPSHSNTKRDTPVLLTPRGQPPKDNPGSMQGLPNRNLITPKFDIHPFSGPLSGQTAPTNIYHANGLAEYDVHNLYSSMMGRHSRNALLGRRPGKRPLIITRSSTVGDSSRVGHWFGDNRSIDPDYRLSISQMIRFPSLYQMPMVGSDVCGFNYDTNPVLCARWAVLGSWNPFFRNHAEISTIYQEFYRWPLVADAARKAIATRYRLLDYTYTNLYRQTTTGRPMLTPLVWQYPHDENVFGNELQFFAGDAFLVSPVTEPSSTSVSFYVPKDTFYDFDTYKRIDGKGGMVTRTNVAYADIPVLLRGGSIVPMRVSSANTTTALREQDFELLIAPSGKDGSAEGYLYLDDGESIKSRSTYLHFKYYRGGLLTVGGSFGYDPRVSLVSVTVLGAGGWGRGDREAVQGCKGYDSGKGTMKTGVRRGLTKGFEVNVLKC